jgi:hypothetical protein
MVSGLAADLDQAERAMSIEGSGSKHLEEGALAHVIRAGTADEDPAGSQHLQSSQIEFLVSTERRVEVALRLGEGWWVEDDGVVKPVGGSIVLQQVERVGFDPFDFALIQSCVLVRHLQGWTGTINPSYGRASGSQVESEASLITENVERLSMSVCSSRGIILALVEEGSGLLSLEGIEVEVHTVHGESG